VLTDLIATLLGRRRRPSPVAPKASAPAAPPAAKPAQRPAVAAATPSIATAAAPAAPAGPPTLTDMLRSMIDDLGGPQLELERDHWLGLSEQIVRIAESMPPPPSFPQIATQLLVLARDPNVDVNDLVGLVQRDAAIASTLVRIANSPAFAPAVPIATLRGAIQSLGISRVVELVVGSAGRSYYDVASAIELALFPSLWEGMFNDALANAFSAGRLALEVPGSRGENALFAGLLSDVGRPIALRILATLVRDGHASPNDAVAAATLDEIAPDIGARAIAHMKLPDELRAACIPDPVRPTPDAQIARLIASIGAIQRRSPRMWDNAGDVRLRAEALGITPYVLRSLFAQRVQYVHEAAELFGRG
jgi:HD-like signal output (HDOD) protein